MYAIPIKYIHEEIGDVSNFQHRERAEQKISLDGSSGPASPEAAIATAAISLTLSFSACTLAIFIFPLSYPRTL